ncbi:hypothetical protein D910_05541 [Dendroctonus ponderosae]
MCTPTTTSPNYHPKCEYFSNGETSLSSLEAALELSQRSFTDYLFESTASINAFAMKMGVLRSTVHHIDLPRKATVNNSTLTTHDGALIEEMQRQLSESVHKNSVRIRRSLLKLSNLSAQYDLLNRPYYELKAYSGQLGQLPKLQQIEPVEKLSYSEALDSVDKIMRDVETVNHKTVHLLNMEDCLETFLGDGSGELLSDEYKSLPLTQ